MKIKTRKIPDCKRKCTAKFAMYDYRNNVVTEIMLDKPCDGFRLSEQSKQMEISTFNHGVEFYDTGHRQFTIEIDGHVDLPKKKIKKEKLKPKPQYEHAEWCDLLKENSDECTCGLEDYLERMD